MKKIFPLLLLTAALLSACGKEATLTVDPGKVVDIQEYNKVAKYGDKPDPVHGKEVYFAYGAMAGVNDTKANGVAYLSKFADEAVSMTVNLNIEQAPKGKKLLVWTADLSGGSALYRGSLTSIVGDTRHSLRFETTGDISMLLNVIITQEPDGSAHDQPGAAVAAGTLVQAQ